MCDGLPTIRQKHHALCLCLFVAVLGINQPNLLIELEVFV